MSEANAEYRIDKSRGATAHDGGASPRPYYQDSFCTIYHGDCRDVLPKLKAIDLIFTSPPYNINNSDADLGHGRNYRKSKWVGSLLRNGYDHCDDALPWPEYEKLQRGILSQMWRTLSDRGAIFYNHKPRLRGTHCWTPLSLIPEEIELRQIIIWARAGGTNFSVTHYLPTHEWILLLAKAGFRLRDQSASGVGDIWRVSQEARTWHPAPFPVGLAARGIETTSAGVVLDPFMGSGSTLRAAKDLGRRAIGIEINESYCEATARRLQQEVLNFAPADEEQARTTMGLAL